MALPDDLMEVLACPKCRGSLREAPAALDCPACDLRYPVRDGIPILLIEEATDGAAASGYSQHTETETESIAFYDDFYRDYNDYRRYNRADVDFVRKLFRKIPLAGPRPRVLDLGSGTGYFHSLIEQMTGYTAYSADFSFEGFRAARDHYRLSRLAVMDAYEMGFKPGAFDAILAIGLTPFKKHEASDVTDLIGRIVQPLKPGGYYVFVWSTNLSGRIEQATVATTDGQQRVSTYYNHSRRFIREAFRATGAFDEVRDFAFIRPLAPLFGPLLLTRANTLLTEAVMKVTPSHLSARLLVIGRRAGGSTAPEPSPGDTDADG